MRWLYILMMTMLAACSTPGRSVDSTTLHAHPEQYIVVAVHNDVMVTYPRAGSTERSYGNAQSYAQSARVRRLLNTLADDYRLQPVASWPIRLLSMECVVFKTLATSSREQLLTQLSRDARVMLAQPLHAFDTQSTVGNHSQYGDSYNDAYANLQSSLQRMDIGAAHRWSRGQGVRVAVIDTGMDSAHPELRGRIDIQRNFVDRDAVQFRRDRHGTAVAGVIAANANNGIGIVGIAPEAQLLALKACWQLQAERDAARCNTFTLAQALVSAIELNADVINLSVVGPSDPLLSALLKQADVAGIIVVGATDGTDGRDAARKQFPVDNPNVLGVTAMEQTGATALPWLPAPGREVLSLLPDGGYDFSSGDSIATAEISGTVALLLAVKPAKQTLPAEQLRQLLASATATNAADQLQSVNACLALSQLNKQVTCATPLRTVKRDAAVR